MRKVKQSVRLTLVIKGVKKEGRKEKERDRGIDEDLKCYLVWFWTASLSKQKVGGGGSASFWWEPTRTGKGGSAGCRSPQLQDAHK